MKLYLIFILGWFGILFTFAQQTKKALFIGNSYIYSNNMPNLLAQMANSTGDVLIHDSNTPGGHTLKQHSTNATTLSKINQGDWDYVILQDQSQYPSLPDNFVQQNVYPYAEALNESILAANSCTETIFFATWGRKNGDQDNCPEWPPVCTYEGMDNLLQERYRFMADENEALLSPVAWVWRYIRENYPNINLYTADNSHPSLAGSYAAAATFYTIMFEKNPIHIPFESSLSPEVAVQLKNAVKEVVFNNLDVWNVSKYNPKSDFIYSATQNPREIQFHNQSENAMEYLWDFGDGTTSTEVNPVHTYSENGSFLVRLTTYKCGLEHSKEIQINTTLSVSEIIQSKHQISPNPVRNTLVIHHLKENEYWNLYNSKGQLLLQRQILKHLNVSPLPIGVYNLVILDDTNQKIKTLRFQKL